MAQGMQIKASNRREQMQMQMQMSKRRRKRRYGVPMQKDQTTQKGRNWACDWWRIGNQTYSAIKVAHMAIKAHLAAQHVTGSFALQAGTL
jgi:hypothetical protein